MQSADAARPGGSGPARVPPVTLIVGEEELLVERAVESVVAAVGLRAAADEADSELGRGGPGSSEPGRGGPGSAADDARQAAAAIIAGEIHQTRAADLCPGDLSSLTAPSLFGGGSLVVVRSIQDAGSQVAAELVRQTAAAPSDVVLVLTHNGGNKGKPLLANLVNEGAGRINCPTVKRFGDRLDFLRAEFGRAGRSADEAGLRALLDAVGNDLRELAAACSQLAADTTGVISQPVVARYYRGRAEATGFTVADRAVEGKLADALEQLRWALATGVSPVLISSALAQGVRALGRVGSAPRGKGAEALAAELGMPPWKIDRVRQQLRGWAPDGVARAHRAVVVADAQVKGEGASPGYALEQAIQTIVACRSRS
jgi:DNA polymerase III subunit delta